MGLPDPVEPFELRAPQRPLPKYFSRLPHRVDRPGRTERSRLAETGVPVSHSARRPSALGLETVTQAHSRFYLIARGRRRAHSVNPGHTQWGVAARAQPLPGSLYVCIRSAGETVVCHRAHLVPVRTAAACVSTRARIRICSRKFNGWVQRISEVTFEVLEVRAKASLKQTRQIGLRVHEACNCWAERVIHARAPGLLAGGKRA